MSRRPTRPAGTPAATRPAHSSSTSASSSASSSSSSKHQNADFTPMNIPARQPSSNTNSSSGEGSNSARRAVGYASSTASAILNNSDVPPPSPSPTSSQPSKPRATSSIDPRASDSEDDDDGPDAADNEEGKRANFRAIMLQAKQEALAEKAAARTEGRTEPASNSDESFSSSSSYAPQMPESIGVLAGAPDIIGPPLLPPQNDEENDLYYCPRLSVANLQRITGEMNLDRVTKLSLHLHTEEQDLADLHSFLPRLQVLSLIPPSSCSSFRDFGRTSLQNILELNLPSVGLLDLEGIDSMNRLEVFRARGNLIEDLSPIMFALKLTILDLGDNKIKECDMIEFIGVLTNLHELELEGNPISLTTHYRSIVGSRCLDIPDFTLDGIRITEEERTKKSDKEESMIDRTKARIWAEKQDSLSAGSNSSRSQLFRAEFNALGAVRPDRSAASSQANSPKSVSASSSIPSSPTHAHSTASSLAARPSITLSSSTSSSSSQRKKDYLRFLEDKEKTTSAESKLARDRKLREKQTAVADIMRLENEMNVDASNAYAARITADRKKHPPLPTADPIIGGTTIPRLQFDASFNASSSPASSPSPSTANHPHFAKQLSTGSPSPMTQPNLSLSTPRPGSASGMRPGSASLHRPASSGLESNGEESAGAGGDASSDLTYGSDSIMAGNYAQAMRARKKQSFSSGTGAESKVDDGGDSSPSSSARGISSSTNKYSRSASPTTLVKSDSQLTQNRDSFNSMSRSGNQATSNNIWPPTTSNNPNQPAIIFKAKVSATGAQQPVVMGSTSAQSAVRPIIPAVSNSSSTMLARHHQSSAAGSGHAFPAGSPLAAARAVQAQQAAGGDEVVLVLGAKQPRTNGVDPSTAPAAAARSAQGKTYTIVRAKK